MKNLYKTIVKKYIAPTIVAGSLILGAYNTEAKASELPPVSEQTRIAMQQKTSEAREKLKELEKSVVGKYNTAISDRSFNIKEQKEIYSEIQTLRKYASEKNLNLSHEIRNLEYGLNTNLNLQDWGKPELQKMFENDGIEILVEKSLTDSDGVTGFLTLGTMAAAFGAIGEIYKIKRSS